MIFIHILFYFFLTTPSLSGFLGSPGPNSVTLFGDRPVGGPSQALKGENAALGSGRALRLSKGSPSRGSAQSCPARQPRRPRPGLSATPAPPAPAQKAAALRPNPGGKGQAAGMRGPQTHHGRRATSAPTAQSHTAPATPVVLVTPTGRPAPSPRWAQRRPLAGGQHMMRRGGALWTAPRPPRLGSWAGPLWLSASASVPHHPDHLDILHLTDDPAAD